MPYRHPQPEYSPPEIVIPNAIPTDERLWVPQAENVWFRPLCLNAIAGLLAEHPAREEIRRALAPPPPPAGARLRAQGQAGATWSTTGGPTEGGYVYEAPGETHTLVRRRGRRGNDRPVPGQRGDDLRRPRRQGAWATRTCSPRSTCAGKHFADVGLGADYVERFIR